jgi:transcriptional regulator with XRE-family HTH domain
MQGFRRRPDQIGRARSRQIAASFGRELRIARVTAGLTQRQLGGRARVSQQMVSQAERGDPSLSLSSRCRLAAACGHELNWRLYPAAGIPLRDSGQLGVASVIVNATHPSWRAQLEVPVAPGDLRAADLILRSDTELVHVEIERSLVDAQAQIRSAHLKRDVIAHGADQPVRLVIAVTDTRATRARLAPFRELLERTFPITSRQIWYAIRNGQAVGGDGILFVRAPRTAPPSP